MKPHLDRISGPPRLPPPPVSADFESDAIFLKLFMTISKDDRMAVAVAIDGSVFRLELFDKTLGGSLGSAQAVRQKGSQ